MKKKNILIYNWAQFDDEKGRGGGVSVYLQSLIPKYLEQGHKIYFISAGCHYSIFTSKLYYEKTKNIYSDQGVESYRVVNSPIKAPSHDSFYQIEECLNNSEIIEIFMEVLAECGQLDEIHIHNIEGISTRLIEQLSTNLSSTLCIWFHNYHWFCPQIDLFKDNNRKCNDYHLGYDCVGCLPTNNDVNRKIRVQRIVSFFEFNVFFRTKVGRIIGAGLKVLYRAVKASSRILNTSDGEVIVDPNDQFQTRTHVQTNKLHSFKETAKNYHEWRTKNIERLNLYADVCICVSGIVVDKLKSFGVIGSKIIEAPLGMNVYNKKYLQLGRDKFSQIIKPLRIGFVGYSSEAKGLPFLCETLLELDCKYNSEITFHVISRISDDFRRDLVRLCRKFKVTVTEGYSRDELVDIGKAVDLVIVPSRWWETYNQVSYEMIMQGVPVLISDSVGISKYLNSDFVFESGSKTSLLLKLYHIINNPSSLEEYWANDRISLPTFDDHFVQLYNDVDSILSTQKI